MVYNEFISDVNATLDTDEGELHLSILDKDGKEILKTKAKLSHNNKKNDAMIRFSFPDHPETGQTEKFKGIVSYSRYGRVILYIYPQFGKGTIATGSIRVQTEGNNEFFQS